MNLADPRRESPTESLSYAHFLLAELPAPQPQQRILTRAGTFFADFAWEEHRLLGEADGLGKYDGAEVARERQRQEALEGAGWRVVRWTYPEIAHRPEVVVARVTAALRRA